MTTLAASEAFICQKRRISRFTAKAGYLTTDHELALQQLLAITHATDYPLKAQERPLHRLLVWFGKAMPVVQGEAWDQMAVQGCESLAAPPAAREQNLIKHDLEKVPYPGRKVNAEPGKVQRCLDESSPT